MEDPNLLKIVSVKDDNSNKLKLGSQTMNALVVSSVRIDKEMMPEVGPSTHQFHVSRNSKLYLSQSSIALAKKVLEFKNLPVNLP